MRIDHQGVMPFKVTEQTSRQLLVGNTVVGRVLQLLPGGEAVMQLPQGLFRVGVNADVKENVTYKMVVTELEPKLVLKVVPQTTEAQVARSPLALLTSELAKFARQPLETPEQIKVQGQKLLDSGAGSEVKQLIGELFRTKDAKFEPFVRAQETFNALQTSPFAAHGFHIPHLGPFENVKFRLEGPKREMLDADHARIVLFLETPRFGETGIDLLVHKRQITIKVYNEGHDLGPFVRAYEPTLSLALHNAGYELSRFAFEQKIEAVPEPFAPLGKVDLRI
ncbi:MAG: hypothetical protein LPJ96_10090 [Exiguobacterium sp.]|uniref:hypothetical protein n=1 Tax=Exiguobacterium alkaliphilum TaxID=1428684 RepID=UPI001BAA06E9|nr:hypothetical protein [Exiguobacterium alkaliphilum]MDX5323953.1 hypothetical protein [Exiguobacterium sp.]MDX5425773.1 hypothetical protein [Exiguobacterium sp.]MDX6773172.1 hypothetical protein [Exiguobacterium sp.]QUE85666.1 hypothetical protein KB235_10925 [Exiguobacterium alkaliphilum]